MCSVIYAWLIKSIILFCASAYEVTIPAEGKALIKTDIAVAIPEGCYGRVGKSFLYPSIHSSIPVWLWDTSGIAINVGDLIHVL